MKYILHIHRGGLVLHQTYSAEENALEKLAYYRDNLSGITRLSIISTEGKMIADWVKPL